jgi:uncharacterized BrkB/YihY/UPF0761 family membrane protein
MGDGERPRPGPERARLWAATVQARAERLSERAQEERGRHRSVDVFFEMVDRDGEAGGGIIAGALAYRFFIWLLPLALVCVAGLGIAADAADETPESAAKTLGLAGLVSNSVASAAEGSRRWYALVVGIPILLYVTRGVLRALIGAHRLLWADVRAAAPRPTWLASLRLLVLILGFGVVSALASAVRAWSAAPGVIVTLVVVLPYAALWLLISVRLPHRDAGWTALIPGALLVGVGVEVLQLISAYVIGPYALAKQGTYGALGIAAVLLFALYLVSRLITTAADLNATLWERRARNA